MASLEHTQSLAEFQHKVTETFERLHRTGETEMIVDNGEVQAILLSPAAYEAMLDAATIQKSRQEIADGRIFDIDAGSARIRAAVASGKLSG